MLAEVDSSKLDASNHTDKDNKPIHPVSVMELSVLRPYLLVGLLAGLLFLSLTSSAPVSAARQMFMQAAFNQTQTERGVSVAITGRVLEINNASIPNAVVSIQVNNPQGTSIHVAIAYSDLTGVFTDSFFIAANSPGGNYTTYLVADKPGYDSARLTLSLTYATPDFSIQSSVSDLSLQQGQSGSLTVTVLSIRGFKQPVNLTALGEPAGVTLRFNPASIVPSDSATVTISISNSAPIGDHTITLLGVSGSLSHKTSFQLIIKPGFFQPANIFIITTAAVLVLVAAVYHRLRGRRARRLAALEELIRSAEADSGYVATARVIARLEELRAMGKVDESTYQRLKKDYEKRLEKSK